MRVARALVPIALCVALASCSSDGGSPATTATTTGDATGTSAAPLLAALPEFDTLDDLVAALDEEGFTCVLEYEGLEDADKVLSICTIEESQAQLTIWKDPADVEDLVAGGLATELTVYGANWTIDLRDPATADAVADALDAGTGA